MSSKESLYRVVTYSSAHFDVVGSSPWFAELGQAVDWKFHVGLGEGFRSVVYEWNGKDENGVDSVAVVFEESEL